MHKGSMILFFTLAIAFAGSAAHALIGLNQCGQGTAPPAGLRCGTDELLLGYRDAAGPCLWVCCPPNSDGRTYDCSGIPAASDSRLDLRNVRPQEWKGLFVPSPTLQRGGPGQE